MARTLTLWLLLVWRDGTNEVLRRHVHFSISVFVDDLQRGEVAEDLVWGGISSDTVLILHHLPQRKTKPALVGALLTVWVTLYLFSVFCFFFFFFFLKPIFNEPSVT